MNPKDTGFRLRLLALADVVAVVAATLLAPGLVLGGPGTTERVSVDSAGGEGNGPQGSFSADISADGRFVAFESLHINLVPGDTNNTVDVFVHDRQTDTTERVSVATDGTQGNNESRSPAISADGRFVAFESVASNLVPGDTNNQFDVFVHDRQTGIMERVSVATDGTQANSFGSLIAAVSADGRFVCFSSNASNLVPGDTNNTVDVFVHDRQTGTTERVSVDSLGNQGNMISNCGDISADGRFVVSLSGASNFVPGDTNGFQDVFVHDRQTGTIERVSVDSLGNQANDHSFSGAISADGRFVAFYSSATNLVPGDTNNTLTFSSTTARPAPRNGSVSTVSATRRMTTASLLAARSALTVASSHLSPWLLTSYRATLTGLLMSSSTTARPAPRNGSASLPTAPRPTVLALHWLRHQRRRPFRHVLISRRQPRARRHQRSWPTGV